MSLRNGMVDVHWNHGTKLIFSERAKRVKVHRRRGKSTREGKRKRSAKFVTSLINLSKSLGILHPKIRLSV